MAYARSEELSELMQRVILDNQEDFEFIGRLGVAVDAMTSDKAKTSGGRTVMGECVRAQELYEAYCPFNYIIIFYLPNCRALTDEQLYVLMYHELLHIQVDETPGGLKYRIRPHDTADFWTVIRRYGINWAAQGAALPTAGMERGGRR